MTDLPRKLIMEKTEDGSCTIYLPEIDEHYHSVKGAFTESQHIFINMGLKHSSVNEPRILEIGFGTGLNAYLTLLEAENVGKTVDYTTIELYPLQDEIVYTLAYPEFIASDRKDDFHRLHTAGWNEKCAISSNMNLTKVMGDYTKYKFPELYFDIIYFDAFAPEKQPEMWTQELFNSLYGSLRNNGILTTYCAKGIVRRMLQTAGFIVERLPGPPGGKREILRATKMNID